MRSIFMLGCLVMLGACQKKDNTVADAAAVRIVINSPAQGQTFHSDDTVDINSSINYPGELHGYEVMVTDTATGFVVYDEAQHTHTDHFTVSDRWSASVSRPTVLKLTLIANIDHNGNNASKEVYFEVLP